MAEDHSPSARTASRVGTPARALICSLIALALVTAACSGNGDAANPDSSSTSPPVAIQVTIDGAARTIAPGSTVGAVLQQFGLKLRDGDLLDVRGEILEAGVDLGKVKVNARHATRLTVLQADDVVQLLPGRNHTEETEETREKFDGERQLNPQTLLGTAPGHMVTTIGTTSGKIESIVFEPSSKPDPPRSVALTFDDGPSDYTRSVLKILKKERVPATFFVVGYLVERSPGMVKDIVRQGHAIGNHSWSHPINPPFAQMEHGKMENQIVRTNDVLATLGIHPLVFRPPGGSYNADVVETARRNGMRTVNWSSSTQDYETSTTAADIIHGVLRDLQPGAIILMHDGGGDASATVKALPTLIQEIRRRGYGFQTLT